MNEEILQVLFKKRIHHSLVRKICLKNSIELRKQLTIALKIRSHSDLPFYKITQFWYKFVFIITFKRYQNFKLFSWVTYRCTEKILVKKLILCNKHFLDLLLFSKTTSALCNLIIKEWITSWNSKIVQCCIIE